jgi:hypothetical protein
MTGTQALTIISISFASLMAALLAALLVFAA